MPAYQPPFQLTHRMTALVADITERLGAWKAANRGALVPELRRGNRIRSLQASRAIVDSLDEAITAEGLVQTTVKATVEKRERTPTAILSRLHSQPELTLAEVAQIIGRSLRTVKQAPTKLEAEDRLRYIGSKKGGRLEIL